MKWVNHGETGDTFIILVGKLERLWHRWEDNIKMDFKEVRCDAVLILLALFMDLDELLWRQ
jgi:hypothetical protein